MIGKYPCQQLHGGHPDHIKQSGVDWDTGLCNHDECKPDDYNDAPDDEVQRILQSAADRAVACVKGFTPEMRDLWSECEDQELRAAILAGGVEG